MLTETRPEATRRDPPHHEGHACPNRACDGYQTYCEDGLPFTQHTHVCPECGCTWQHGPGGS